MSGCTLVLLAAGRGETATTLVFSLIAAAIGAALVILPARNRLLNLRAVARRFGGTVRRGFHSNPTIGLNVDGTPAEVTSFAGRKGHSPWTRIRFFEAPPFLLRIVPEGLFASLRKAFGSQDLQTGDPAFDGRFLVQGSPPERAIEALDEKTRRRLLHLDRIGAPLLSKGGVSLDAGPAGITLFSYLCLTEDREELALFIRQAIEIYRRLRASAPAEPRPAAKEETAGDKCPLCGNPLDATARRCGDCDTAYHRDCWQYFGGCAIYGCSRRLPSTPSA